MTPVGHVISDYEFDVIIGADGTRNTLEGSTIIIICIILRFQLW